MPERVVKVIRSTVHKMATLLEGVAGAMIYLENSIYANEQRLIYL